MRSAKAYNSLPVEVWGYRQYEQLGVPAPRVLAYRADPPSIGCPTMIMTKLRGQPLGTIKGPTEEGVALYRRLGQVMRTMHEVRVAGFGRLRVDRGTPTGQGGSWQAYVRNLPRAYVTHYLCRHHLIDEDEEELLIGHLNRLDEARLDQAVFLHGDLTRVNVLVDHGRIAGIVDLEKCFAGDPRFDVAVALQFQTTWQRPAFIEGYGRVAEDPWVGHYHVWLAASRLEKWHRTGRPSADVSLARRALTEALHDAWPPPDRAST